MSPWSGPGDPPDTRHRSLALRPLREADLDAMFEQMRDPEAVRMAAFVHRDPDDRQLFEAHIARVTSTAGVTHRTITLADDDTVVLGSIASFVIEGDTEVTYWVDRTLWGQGVASRALALLLEEVTTRPVYGRAASDNVGSQRVLENNGFRVIGTDKGFAMARDAEIEETILRLDAVDGGP